MKATFYKCNEEAIICENSKSRSGILMLANDVGCGTWTKTLWDTINVSGGFHLLIDSMPC